MLALIDGLRQRQIGRPVHGIRSFLRTAYADFGIKRGSMELYCAISGIEIALWDIVAKAAGQPVSNLLGGPCHESIEVYANGWFHKFDGSAEKIDAGARPEVERRALARPASR